MAKRRRGEFVVGRAGARELVYGRYASLGCSASMDPLTAVQALRQIRNFVDAGGRAQATIYRLVEVPPAEVERQAAREKRARKVRR